jgi:hypothetical protein
MLRPGRESVTRFHCEYAHLEPFSIERGFDRMNLPWLKLTVGWMVMLVAAIGLVYVVWTAAVPDVATREAQNGQ